MSPAGATQASQGRALNGKREPRLKKMGQSVEVFLRLSGAACEQAQRGKDFQLAVANGQLWIGDGTGLNEEFIELLDGIFQVWRCVALQLFEGAASAIEGASAVLTLKKASPFGSSACHSASATSRTRTSLK